MKNIETCKDWIGRDIELALSHARMIQEIPAGSRELSLVITKLQEAQLWLGEVK